MQHTTVLLHESIDNLDIQPGDIFVDGTIGGGGHSEEVAQRFGDRVKIIGIDQDTEALERTKARLAHIDCDVTLTEGNFRDIDTILESIGFAQVNKILLDIGLSSNQFEDSGRGFSFQKDEPLVMSFKKEVTNDDLTAREIVNSWDEENIKAILEGYGEEKFAYKIAKAIVAQRKIKPIETTFDLVNIVKSATPAFYHHRKIHPATKTFQALRITVNNEIGSLQQGIAKGFEKLESNGRMAIISFHSLEDRVVKQFFKQKEEEGMGERITKRPITPTEEEILRNPRSRSAKLRIIRKQ